MSNQALEFASPATAVGVRASRLRSAAARVLFFSGAVIGFTSGYLSARLLPAIDFNRIATPVAQASTSPVKAAATPAIRKPEVPAAAQQVLNATPSPTVVVLNPGTAGEMPSEPSKKDVGSSGIERTSPQEFQRGSRKKHRAQVD